MKEYEVKIPVDDLSKVEERLKQLGWKLIDEVFESDHYIDFRECVGIPADKIAFRIRIKKNLITGDVKGEVTYKGEVLETGVKAREELTAIVKDPEELVRMFVRLGFRIYALKKKRSVYEREGKVKVYLDDVEGLGKFVEVEVMDPASKEKFMKLLDSVKSELGLEGKPNITTPYLDMLLESVRK